MQITTGTPTAPLKKIAQPSDKSDGKLKKACQDFEAIILRQMLATMRKSVPKTGLLDSGYAQDMYHSMQDDSLAQNLATGKGMGLAELLYSQISGEMHPGKKE